MLWLTCLLYRRAIDCSASEWLGVTSPKYQTKLWETSRFNVELLSFLSLCGVSSSDFYFASGARGRGRIGWAPLVYRMIQMKPIRIWRQCVESAWRNDSTVKNWLRVLTRPLAAAMLAPQGEKVLQVLRSLLTQAVCLFSITSLTKSCYVPRPIDTNQICEILLIIMIIYHTNNIEGPGDYASATSSTTATATPRSATDHRLQQLHHRPRCPQRPLEGLYLPGIPFPDLASVLCPDC